MASINSSDRDDPPPAASPKGSVVNLTARRAERALARIAARREGIASIRPGVGAETIRVIVREELGSLRRELSELATTTDNVLTLDGAAELLGVCSKTVLAWRRDKGLPAHRAGSTWRFLRSELLAWVRAQRGRDVR
jgi:excisionase family DNA binding protein